MQKDVQAYLLQQQKDGKLSLRGLFYSHGGSPHLTLLSLSVSLSLVLCLSLSLSLALFKSPLFKILI